MSVPLTPSGASLDERRDGVADVHQAHFKDVERIHGWCEAVPFGGQFAPICICGNIGPFVLTRDAMYELVCERGELERAEAARRALVGR